MKPSSLSMLVAICTFAASSVFAGHGSSNHPGDNNGHGDPGSRPGSRSGHQLLAFDTMYGVDGPFVGDASPIRGIPGDELPWVIGQVSGSLDTDGHLTVRVRGLVFKDEDPVPPALRGINDETEFRAAVSCLSESEDESQVTERNVITSGFPATRSGNSLIRTTVKLPNPCIAPMVLILAGSEDKWFAISGFEAEEEGD